MNFGGIGLKLQKKLRTKVATVKVVPETYTGSDTDFMSLIPEILQFMDENRKIDGLVLDFSRTGFMPMKTLSAIDLLVQEARRRKKSIGVVGLPMEIAGGFAGYVDDHVNHFETVREACSFVRGS